MWTNFSLGNASAGSTVYRVNTPSYANASTNDTVADPADGHSLAESIMIGTVLTLFIIIAIVGNILVCIAVFTDRHLRRNSNFFLVSLAIADLLMAVLVMTFAVANDILDRWLFGSVFCNIWISADIMCSTASILNLCAISLDRYIHIRDPLRYENWMTTCKTGLFITSVWVMSIIISFIPIHLKWHKNPAERDQPDLEGMCNFELNPIYAIVSSTISFYIPTIVMLAIYCQLYIYAKRHVASIRKTYTSERLQSQNTNKSGSTRVSDHKAAVTLGIIMGVFLFCWMPFFIFNLIAAFCKCVPPILFKILTWLGYVNSGLNPIIYSIFNQEFREAFRKILFTRPCRRDPSVVNLGNSRSAYRKSLERSDTYLHTLENGNHLDCKQPLYEDKITTL